VDIKADLYMTYDGHVVGHYTISLSTAVSIGLPLCRFHGNQMYKYSRLCA
jgi:hypothetical protein